MADRPEETKVTMETSDRLADALMKPVTASNHKQMQKVVQQAIAHAKRVGDDDLLELAEEVSHALRSVNARGARRSTMNNRPRSNPMRTTVYNEIRSRLGVFAFAAKPAKKAAKKAAPKLSRNQEENKFNQSYAVERAGQVNWTLNTAERELERIKGTLGAKHAADVADITKTIAGIRQKVDAIVKGIKAVSLNLPNEKYRAKLAPFDTQRETLQQMAKVLVEARIPKLTKTATSTLTKTASAIEPRIPQWIKSMKWHIAEAKRVKSMYRGKEYEDVRFDLEQIQRQQLELMKALQEGDREEAIYLVKDAQRLLPMPPPPDDYWGDYFDPDILQWVKPAKGAKARSSRRRQARSGLSFR